MAEQGLLQIGNKGNIIHCLLNPHPSDFNSKTSHCNSDENDEYNGRNEFNNVNTSDNNDENGEDDNSVGFDDRDTKSLEEVAELEEELKGYTIAKLEVKLVEQGHMYKNILCIFLHR